MYSHLTFAILLLYCGTSLAGGQEPQVLRSEDVRALLQANGTQEMVAQMAPVAAREITISFRRDHPNLPLEIDGIVTSRVTAYINSMTVRDEIIEKLIPVYAKYFTADEVRQITQFYSSPLGRKLVHVKPELSAEEAQIGYQWIRSILPRLKSQLSSELRNEKLMD